jgi:hypothetical protein
MKIPQLYRKISLEIHRSRDHLSPVTNKTPVVTRCINPGYGTLIAILPFNTRFHRKMMKFWYCVS